MDERRRTGASKGEPSRANYSTRRGYPFGVEKGAFCYENSNKYELYYESILSDFRCDMSDICGTLHYLRNALISATDNWESAQAYDWEEERKELAKWNLIQKAVALAPVLSVLCEAADKLCEDIAVTQDGA